MIKNFLPNVGIFKIPRSLLFIFLNRIMFVFCIKLILLIIMHIEILR